jgi:hypothetical protein
MRGFVGVIPVSAYVSRCDAALSQLEAAGLRIPSNSRLRRYRDDLATIASYPGPVQTRSRALIERMLNDGMELLQLLTLLSVLGTRLSQNELDRINSGRPYAADDKDNQDGRNIQFQYFVAATLESCGVAVDLVEPDILAHFRGIPIAMPVKRVRSPKKLVRRVRECDAQCQRAGRDGVAVVDVSRLILREAHYLDVPDDGTAYALLENGEDRLVAEILRGFAAPAALFGVGLYAATPAIVAKKEIVTLSHFSFHPLRGASVARKELLQSLTSALSAALQS